MTNLQLEETRINIVAAAMSVVEQWSDKKRMLNVSERRLVQRVQEYAAVGATFEDEQQAKQRRSDGALFEHLVGLRDKAGKMLLGDAAELAQRVDQVDAAPSSSSASTPAPAPAGSWQQLEQVRDLYMLALAEEVNDDIKAILRKTRMVLGDGRPRRLATLRALAENLRVVARRGGPLHTHAQEWLDQPENGGGDPGGAA